MAKQGTSVIKWSRADFLDRADELKRRLEVWHIDGAEPLYCPRDAKSLMRAERQTFRDRVMAGEHNPHPDFVGWNLLEEGEAAIAIRRPKDPYSKTITVWEFRDFVEHLNSDAGHSDAAKLVRLKLERLLDAPIHKRARNEEFGDHIVGRAVDPSLIQEFVEAVRALANTSETSGDDPSPEAVQEGKQSITPEKKIGTRRRTDPSTCVNKLRQKIAAAAGEYAYESYEELVKDIGGSKGTWTNIFKNPENVDLVEWKENRGVYARNCQAAAEQVAYEQEEYLPDEEVEKLIEEEIKKLPNAQQQQAREQFRKLDSDTKRKTIQTLSRS